MGSADRGAGGVESAKVNIPTLPQTTREGWGTPAVPT